MTRPSRRGKNRALLTGETGTRSEAGDDRSWDAGPYSPPGVTSIPAGTYRLADSGGEEVAQAHGSLGSTETIDLANGNYHSGTLNANCTFTFTGATNGVMCDFVLELTQDGTGGWTSTFPGSVVDGATLASSLDTTLSTTSLLVFVTRDGGTTWYGYLAGASSGGGALTDHTHAVTGSGATGGGASLAPTTLILPQGTTPAQTAEGSAVWDTDDDKLTIGTGAARKTMVNEGAVTTSGLTQATARLLGRTTASTGAIEEITVGTGLSLSAGSLTATGGSGPTIQYPSLKPGTPTYDFAGAALDGAFTAHSSGGSFVTGNCMTQGWEWNGSALEMQFSTQMGGLHVSHSNTDFDFSVGGLGMRGLNLAAGGPMFGIAALNSVGTGVGVVAYNDNNLYLATITTWSYASNSDAIAYGWQTNNAANWWMRLKRVSGTWTGYASMSGRAWDKTFTTRSDSITVDRLFVGLLYNSANTYTGRLICDWFQVDV